MEKTTDSAVQLDDFILDTTSADIVTDLSPPVVEEEEETKEETKDEVKEEIKEETKEKPISKKEEEEDKEVDSEIDKEIESRVKETGKTKEEVVSELKDQVEGNSYKTFKPLYEGLHQALGWEAPEDGEVEDTWEGFTSYVQNIVEANSAPKYSSQETKDFDDFVKAGGNPKTFWDTVYGQANFEGMNVDSISSQKDIMRTYYNSKNTNWDSQKVSDKISKLEETGLLEDHATDALEDLQINYKKEKESLNVRLEEDKRVVQENYIHRLEDLKSQIVGSETIAGYSLKSKDKDGFYGFLTERNEEGVTKYKEFLADKDNALKLALFAFKGADASKFKIAAGTDVTKDILKSLSRYTDGGATAGDSTKNISSKEESDKSKEQYNDFIF